MYSPRLEGVHLRFGRVARGGLRWSERLEDFRTEVLGLVKAQEVKNSVIVPVRGQGRLRLQAAARPGRPRGVPGRGAWPATGRSSPPARRHRQHRRRPGGAAAAGGPPRRRRPVPGGRRRQGHRDVLRHRQRDRRPATGSGWATRSPRAAPRATTTRRWASRPAAPGSRSAGTSRALRHEPGRRRLHRRPASATCPATCSATGCCSREHIKLVAAFDHRHVFLDPTPTRRSASPSGSGCSPCPGRPGPTTTRR